MKRLKSGYYGKKGGNSARAIKNDDAVSEYDHSVLSSTLALVEHPEEDVQAASDEHLYQLLNEKIAAKAHSVTVTNSSASVQTHSRDEDYAEESVEDEGERKKERSTPRKSSSRKLLPYPFSRKSIPEEGEHIIIRFPSDSLTKAPSQISRSLQSPCILRL